MLRPPDRIAAGAIGCVRHMGVATAAERDTGHLVLGTPHQRVGPHRRQRGCVHRIVDRVVVDRILVADDPGSVVLEANLPEGGVAREERGVAPGLHITLDGIAHALGPVLVVTDGHVGGPAVQQAAIAVEIRTDRMAELPSPGFRPADEQGLPVSPSGGDAPGRVVAPEARDVVARPGLEEGDTVLFGTGLVQEATRQRSPSRRHATSDVEARASPVVVRAPGGGREHQHRVGRLGSAHDEEGFCRLSVVVRQPHQVHARGPAGIDRDLERRAPPAASAREIGRHRLRGARQGRRLEHDVFRCPLPGDLHAKAARLAVAIQGEGLARQHALGPAVAGDHGDLLGASAADA